MIFLLYCQVFDNTPAALDGTLAAGDEITGVNGKTVKGKTKVEVAKMIQAVQVQDLQWCSDASWFQMSFGLHHLFLFVCFQGEVTIHYNKLQADPKQGKSLDIGTFIHCSFHLNIFITLCWVK